MKQSVSVERLAFAIAVILISAGASYFLAEPLRLSEKPSEYIAVIFSILAAALFAVIAIIGDPSMLLPGGVRVGWESAKSIQANLQKFNHLFLLYLCTLGLLVICEIVKSEKADSFYWLYYVYTFFASFGFIASLALPYELSRVQSQRLAEEIDARSRGGSTSF
ncbi:hypothetical protein GRZ55_11650 [Chelativorans sp. ZYF759]|uniref:hypothetical protein n=1 Tax=Chelativorans sp. ZYF759 TaxID=2692213 RepID=UPI00145DE9BE|nr:hypothetical protein [Chelativorans sp. ZYF759]NMG39898.1 hypothetical protein [Chelativorans sp. ZYF759]